MVCSNTANKHNNLSLETCLITFLIPEKQKKTIFWLLSKLFLNEAPPYHKVQDPNYLHNINDVNNGMNDLSNNNRNAKPGNNNYNLLDSLNPKK